MPAATPKPSLEDLLIILSRSSDLRANFPNHLSGDIVELCFTFRREHLGPAADFVFSYPSSIFPALKELLEFDDVAEKAFRIDDPRNTVDDTIGYIEQKLYNVQEGSGLAERMDAAFLKSTLKYLRELNRRRREADRRAKDSAEARRRRDEEEIKRRVEEEIRQREQQRQQAKAEAHRRWEEEEARKRAWQEKKTSDSGRESGFRNPFEEMFRSAGIDPNDPMWGATFRRASAGFDYSGNPYEQRFKKSFYGHSERRSPPPPPTGGKRSWYDVLGCPPGANRDEIRRAAREKAKGLHPDTSSDPKAKEKFQEISQAKAEGLAGCV